MQCLTKTGFFAVNLLVFLWGIVQICTAIVVFVRGDPYTLLTQDFTFSIHIANCVVGVVILLTGFLAWYGVIRKNVIMLKVYVVLVSVFLVIEVVLGATAVCLARFAEPVMTQVMDNFFDDYGTPGRLNVSYSIDLIQNRYFCCGVRNYTDWEQYPFGKEKPQSVADGCCKGEYFAVGCGTGLLAELDAESKIYTRGCFHVVLEFILAITLTVGTICVIIAFLQLMSVISAHQLGKQIMQTNLPENMHLVETERAQPVRGNK